MSNNEYLEEALNTRKNTQQEAITFAFERLIRHKEKTFKAIQGDSKLHLTFNGSNPNASLLSRANRTVFPVMIPNLSEDDILENPTFQRYKNTLSDEGFDIDITETNRTYDVDGAQAGRIAFKVGLIGLTTVTTAFTLGVISPSTTPELFMAGYGMSITSVLMGAMGISTSTAGCDIKITPKPTHP